MESQLLCDRLQGIAEDLHVVGEGYTERLSSRDEVIAMHAASKRLVLHLLAHRARLDRAERLIGLDEGARDDEAGHLVDGVQRLADVRVARDAEVVGM